MGFNRSIHMSTIRKNRKCRYCVLQCIITAGLGLILFTVPIHSASADTLSLTLEEAAALGLKNSTTLRAKALTVSSAQADVRNAKSALYPGVSVTASWTHLFDQPKTPDMTVDFGMGPIDIPGTYAGASDPISISAELSQSIYTFGRIADGVHLAEVSLHLARLDLEEEKRSLIVKIQRAFYGYILAKEVVRVQNETLLQKKDALEIAKKRFEAGLSPDYEVLSAESDLESFKPEVISAENEVKFTLLAVKDLLGIEDEGEYDIELIGELKPEYHNFDEKKLTHEAVQNNYNIRQMMAQINLADYTESLKKREKRPTIGGFANYTLKSGYDSTTGENKYWGTDSWDGNLSVGILVQMQLSALFPWSSENISEKKAAIDLETLRTSKGSAESGIRLNIKNILLQLEKEKAKIGSTIEKLYESAQHRYENGLISNTELKDAQLRLNNARLGYLQSVYNYKSAVFDLEDAVGVDHFD
jgi:outer membrane protein